MISLFTWFITHFLSTFQIDWLEFGKFILTLPNDDLANVKCVMSVYVSVQMLGHSLLRGFRSLYGVCLHVHTYVCVCVNVCVGVCLCKCVCCVVLSHISLLSEWCPVAWRWFHWWKSVSFVPPIPPKIDPLQHRLGLQDIGYLSAYQLLLSKPAEAAVIAILMV